MNTKPFDVSALPETLLKLPKPWHVTDVETDEARNEISVHVRCEAGAALRCPHCDFTATTVYDHQERRIRDLDWAEFKVYLVVAVPRIQCPDHKIVQIAQPWLSRPRVRTTTRFEAHVMAMLKEASIRATACLFRISDKQVARIQADAVQRGLARRELVCVPRISVDETSFRKRHRYVTIVNDLQGRALHVHPGHDEAALASYFQQFEASQLSALEYVVMDMSQAYRNAVERHTDAIIVYDRFHIIAALNRAVDQVRRRENTAAKAQGDTTLNGQMHTLRRAKANMRKAERDWMDYVKRAAYKVARAWQRVELARHILTDARVTRFATAERRWQAWLKSARLSRLTPLKKVADTIERHLPGVINASITDMSNAHAESLNGRVQKLKKRANGYRNMDNFMNAIYFHYGGLDMSFNT